MKRYNPKIIEPKWQNKWLNSNIYQAIDFDNTRPKYVMLTEFPYPSGDGIHLGHVREYTLGDIIARYKRMNGFNVLFPMGYDAFGLPTENYAIKNNIKPEIATKRNINNFQQQFNNLGYSIDWSRSFQTTDPNYYKWTQWLFLQFFKAGLAYQDISAINWCPVCKTGIANEEVVNGRHERCDNLVEKKRLKQWYLQITKYADKLIAGLDTVDYPDRIKEQQINWIGKSRGAEIIFKIEGQSDTIKVFTTREDTIYGVSFIVLAPEHQLLTKITSISQKGSINSYIKKTIIKSEIERQDTSREKTGVFSGAYAINPINSQKIPVWTADYVLSSYGTGAIMAVPAHDNRDYEFAEKYNLPILEVIDRENNNLPYLLDGKLKNSAQYNGLTSKIARQKILHDLEKSKQAKTKINYKLHDWIFSRQRYWGEPIPIIHCPDHGAVAINEKELPLKLPETEEYMPTDTAESPLAKITNWVNTTCPICQKPAKRETDTMPNWAGSSWYYLRFYDPHNKHAFADAKKLGYWNEVDLYLGGMEHVTLHLLYSRFWHQFLYDQKLVPTKEPYKSRRGQGIILASDGTKMSKSKGNNVNPNDIINQGYGADSIRLAITFIAPYTQTTPWNPEIVAGTYRFLNRLFVLIQEFSLIPANKRKDSKVQTNTNQQLLKVTHYTIKQVTGQIESMGFNKAIAALMEGTNNLYKIKEQDNFASENWLNILMTFVLLVAPFAPHIAEELWQQLGQNDSVHLQQWPVYNEQYLIQESIPIVIQINGKYKLTIQVSTQNNEKEIIKQALAQNKIQKIIGKNKIKKRIYIPSKVINFVI